jgi:murein DD-endopeptidase MepM/ murein hydrolase activator NlpD
MSKMTVATKRFSGFMKRNATYLLIFLCIASVATVIALAATGTFGPNDLVISDTPNQDDTPIDPPVDDTPVDKPNPPVDDTPVVKPLTFTSPTTGTLVCDYSNTLLVWNSTLGQYSTHLGVDFIAEDGLVMAVASGTVKEVGYDTLNGNYVILTHADGYESRYYSLKDGITLSKGDKVTEGQVIGEMSTSMATESLDGNHLHFEMSKDGQDINPLEVIPLEEK